MDRIDMKKTTKVAVVAFLVVISLFRSIYLSSLINVLSLLTPIVVVLLGLTYKKLNASRYPTGIVLAQIFAFYSLGYLTHEIWFESFTQDPFLSSGFQIYSAIVFMFPAVFFTWTTRLFSSLGVTLPALTPFEIRGVPSDVQLTVKSNWVKPIQVYLIAVVAGLMFTALTIYIIAPFLRPYLLPLNRGL